MRGEVFLHFMLNLSELYSGAINSDSSSKIYNQKFWQIKVITKILLFTDDEDDDDNDDDDDDDDHNELFVRRGWPIRRNWVQAPMNEVMQ